MFPKTDTRRNGRHHGSVEGIIEIENQGQLPQEFITIGDGFAEALGRCVLRDDEQKNCVIIYKAQLEMFEMWEEIDDLTNWLNASAAVGGFNRSLAAMTHVGTYFPVGAGIKMGKDDQKALMEMQRDRLQYQQREQNNDNGQK